jgi:hypothetical protein
MPVILDVALACSALVMTMACTGYDNATAGRRGVA